MKRRECLKLGGMMALIPVIPAMAQDKNRTNKLQKVLRAMLSMQRASWEQGVAAQAILELGDDELLYLMASEAVLRQHQDGRLSVLYSDNGVTDPAASGEAVLYAAKKWQETRFREAAYNMLSYLMNQAPRIENGTISHTLNANEIWIDSMYMAPPFLAVCGEYEEAMKQINGIHSILWNADHQMYSHRWSAEKKEFVNEKFWGVGNGWAVAGMSRVLAALPASMEKEKEILKTRIQNTLAGCLKHLREDFLFHNNIDEPDTFVETNLSQMLTYTIFRGIHEQWLAESYLDIALKMRKAAHAKVDNHGYVQDVCGAPFFDSPGVATEGQAFYILMEAAYKKLTTKN